MIDPYAILGLTPDATKEDVQRRFRELAKKTHPDMHRGNKEFEERFKMYSEAYNKILSEKELYERIEKDADFFHQHFRQREAEPQYRQEGSAYKKEMEAAEEENLSYEEFLQFILKKTKEENKREKKEKKVNKNKNEETPRWAKIVIAYFILSVLLNLFKYLASGG